MLKRMAILALFASLTLAAASARTTPTGDDPVVPLVLVNEDTVTTYDLEMELGLLKKMKPDAEAELPAADQVLRRLIQNELILQEGYRMGMDKTRSVANQVRELIRTKSIVVLLDSVALSVPDGTPDLTETRREAVHSYVKGLISSQSVSVDSTLLHSLDYGSADESVQKHLQESDDVLVVLPTGKITVARFTKILRFQEFHGLVGKPDAAERRDKAFDEWLTEAVLSHQALSEGIDQRPDIQEAARNLEHILVRQETITALLKNPAKPGEKEIEKFYNENIASFMAPARIKMRSKKLNTKEAAEAFREKLHKGADIEWLAGQDPQVVAGKDPFPYEWFSPDKLGLSPEDAKIGFIPQPYGVPGGWVVAIVTEVEDPKPIPLSQCRSKVVGQLMAQEQKRSMTDILARLEEASHVEILPGAEATVQGVLEEAGEPGAAGTADGVN